MNSLIVYCVVTAAASTLTRGSHYQFVRPTKPGAVTVPHPKKDPGKGLVRAIRKQAGLR
jgi:predicted RNA binding protein YcfA (HicA-like mRNA interferase family)